MTKIKKDNTIFKTDDYSIFKRIDGNRNESSSHIKRLVKSFNSDPASARYNPILVNDKYEIIDGQHRIKALEELGLPVYFVQEDGLSLGQVRNLNTNTKNWNPTDFARSFAEIGNNNYQIYLEFKKAYKINHDVLQQYLSPSRGMTTEAFKNGMLKVEDKELSQKLCEQINELSEYYERAKNRAIALGFLKVGVHEDYNHERMVEKFRQTVTNPSMRKSLDAANHARDGIRALEDLFNHKLSKDKEVMFH